MRLRLVSEPVWGEGALDAPGSGAAAARGGVVPVTAPERLELRPEASRLELRARVPEDLVYLEGHFPGHPLVPGFVQLAWALELAHEQLGCDAPPARIEALKYRSFLAPGAVFDLALEASGDRLRFAYRCAGEEISSGRLRLDPALAQHRPLPRRATSTTSDVRDLPLRLPQTGRMRVIDAVASHDAGVTLCDARIGGATPLLRGGRAPASLALELLGQAMAAQGGLEAGAAARRAFLVGARRIELRTRGFLAGERLWVRAEHLRGESGFVVAECSLGTGDPPGSRAAARERALAWGPLTAWVEASASGSATP